MIPGEIAEHWRQLSLALDAQVELFKTDAQTKPDWEALIAVKAAARQLWSAFAWVASEHSERG